MPDIRLGHSPDSDDAFMFHGLASGSVDTADVRFEHILRDIQTLNEWAREGRLECTAISVHAYTYVHDRYAILTHGASMGDGYGPMLVARQGQAPDTLAGKTVAIPGTMTSAFLALGIYSELPLVEEGSQSDKSTVYRVVPFDHIEAEVAEGRVDVGLIIHEGQLTHRDAGLECMVDLGVWWKERTGLPLPLGVNTIRRDIEPDLRSRVSSYLQQSIVYGLSNRHEALDYALGFARDMERPTADQFVGMYVNDWTVDMGEAGKESIRRFLAEGSARGLCPTVDEVIFQD